MKQLFVTLGLGLMALVLAAYGSAAAGEAREVHFFEVNALTGQSASYGTRTVHGVELGAKHINASGGFTDSCGNTYTVKVTPHDMANSREQAIAGLRKAADDPTVLASLGSTPSTGSSLLAWV